ncbi:D-2-hydroxyglutarate dehydrogenase, mitochondrial, partial [Perkinsus olseni]
NVATNAGGLRLLRYGSLRGTILGLEVVTAEGKILDLMRALRKDNTGYDLKQLFIGSEGTLGIVTKAALLRVSSFNEVIRLLSVAKASLGEALSAFEYFDGQCVKCLQMNGFNDLLKNLPPGRRSEEQDYYALVEVNGNNAHNIELKIHNFVEEAESHGGVPVEGMLSHDIQQEKDLWKIRENIPVALNREGVLHKYDVSLPVSAMDDLVRHVRREFHRREETPIHKELDTEIYEYTKDMRGSIAGEHGLGTLKRDKIFYSKPALAVDYMKQMKNLFDPHGILNPGKVLPDTIPPESQLP